MSLKKCISFNGCKEGEWTFVYDDGSVLKRESFIIPCSLVGYIEMKSQSHIEEAISRIEDIWQYCSWNFLDKEYCPIKIGEKWGFIDSFFNIVCEPQFSSVGRVLGPYWDAALVCDWENDIIPVWIENEEHILGSDFKIHDELKQSVYEARIKEIDELSIDDIIRITSSLVDRKYRNEPWKYVDDKGRTLDRGKAVLETEEQCNAYMAAYGKMHKDKLFRALCDDEFPYDTLNQEIEIYDWGCGQGIGTMALIENLHRHNLLDNVSKVYLEEPSFVARHRAEVNVRRALQSRFVFEAKIYSDSRFLPSDEDNTHCISSIQVNSPFAIHIFSNILDIEAVSLKGVSNLITSSGTTHIVLCIGPANLNLNISY